MQIAVYDTYVQRPDGRKMHFDVLVPAMLNDLNTVLSYGQTYLTSKGLPPSILQAERCNFCHMESANSVVQKEIATNGFSIIEMEHCD